MIRIVFIIIMLVLYTPAVKAGDSEFIKWLNEFKAEALKKNISQKTLDLAFRNIAEPLEKVIKSDRTQAEFTQTFWTYMQRTITPKRFDNGNKNMQANKVFLNELEKKYGVQGSYLVAFWGLESSYGENIGNLPLIHSLATLAFDNRRPQFFRNELLEALKILEKNPLQPEKLVGSWAGAMGMTQFMPSTFNNYAVDGDGDGKKDIWQNPQDALASAANYLQKINWQEGAHWGREVQLPPKFDYNHIGMDIIKPVSEWNKLGVKTHRGEPLPENYNESSIIAPMGISGPSFIVYKNYRVILIWNKSELYALAVGLLSDWLSARDSAQLTIPDNPSPLANNDIKYIQETLNKAGLYTAEIDGKLGTGTRQALREYQRQNAMIPDGYPSTQLIQQMVQKYGRPNP